MKVRVEYTDEFDDEALACLAAYHREKMSRSTLRQLLIDEGRGGIDEQIVLGRERLKQYAERCSCGEVLEAVRPGKYQCPRCG